LPKKLLAQLFAETSHPVIFALPFKGEGLFWFETAIARVKTPIDSLGSV
jgi:hypothetical protein